jgi:biopolymer transport protein ExbD
MAGAAASSNGDDDDGALMSDINVTPLVDVTLVLLIIMMVAAPLLASTPSIKVDLPKASAGDDAPPSPVLLTLKKEGGLYWGDAAIAEDEARRCLVVERDKDPQLLVVIAADRGVAYGGVIRVLDLVRSLGITRFALNIDVAP